MDMEDPLDFEFEDPLITSSVVTKKRFSHYNLFSLFFFFFNNKIVIWVVRVNVLVWHYCCNSASGFLEIFIITMLCNLDNFFFPPI